jgi:uncharacterized protein YrrD
MISVSRLLGKAIDALDGQIGSVHDLYFEESTWNVRYLVLDTGKWLTGRKVLVAPEAIVKPWHDEGPIPVNLTKEQIKSSPDIDTAVPISRLAEELLHRHYRWLPYWDVTTVPVPPPPPPPVVASSEEERREAEAKAESLSEARLRNAKEVRGYHVQATDGEVGRVDDFLVDDDCTRILFLSIDVKGWLFGKKVLVGPSLVSRVDWASSTIYVDTVRQALKSSQEYDPAA